jgi:hypothetical protein
VDRSSCNRHEPLMTRKRPNPIARPAQPRYFAANGSDVSVAFESSFTTW